ncbi:MAG TPA: DUF998 domain-containing protein, partial [Methanoregulaceae archaeon]|nr:DUF998 domain-containing protein [Methanoregulaceae archaeon]
IPAIKTKEEPDLILNMRPDYQNVAGVLLFLAGFIALMGIITGEIFYPAGYSTAHSEISDLGSTRPPEALIFQPSATIFNTTMILAGILIITGAYCASRSGWERWSSLLLGLLGVGILGVGIFPGNVAVLHPLFAMFTFVIGGIAAVLSSRGLPGPYRYLSVILGAITLLSLLLMGILIPVLGDGGTERFVAYPLIFWLTGLGAYFLGRASMQQQAPHPA